MDNTLYNLMHQLTQEQKSLWRIKKDYAKDAIKNTEVKKFWMQLTKEKEAQIKSLKELLKKNLK